MHCARSPGKSADSSGRELRSRAVRRTSHGGLSRRNSATSGRKKYILKNNDQVSTNLGCLPLPGWCSMHPSGQRYCLLCTAPTLLLGPDVHFHSPAHTRRDDGIHEQCHKFRFTIKQK